MRIERHRADRAEFQVDIERGELFRLHPFQRLQAELGIEIARRDELDALFRGKAFRALARQHHVRAVGHHLAREQDGIAHGGDACDRAGIARAAVHDRGIELVRRVPGIDRTLARVETRLVFHDQDRRLDRVERAAAFGQHLRAGIERGLQGGAMRGVFFGRHAIARDGAGAAMDGERPPGLRMVLRRDGVRNGEREARGRNGEAGEKSSHASVIAAKVIHSSLSWIFGYFRQRDRPCRRGTNGERFHANR